MDSELCGVCRCENLPLLVSALEAYGAAGMGFCLTEVSQLPAIVRPLRVQPQPSSRAH